MRYNKQHILIALLYFTFYTLLKNYIYYCCLYRSNRSPMAFTANAHAFFAYDLKIGSNCFLFLVDSSSSIFLGCHNAFSFTPDEQYHIAL